MVFVWRSIDKAEAGRWMTDKMSWFVIRSLCLKTNHINTHKKINLRDPTESCHFLSNSQRADNDNQKLGDVSLCTYIFSEPHNKIP